MLNSTANVTVSQKKYIFSTFAKTVIGNILEAVQCTLILISIENPNYAKALNEKLKVHN